MKKILVISFLLLLSLSSTAQRFEDYFEDRTLRLDYTFAGDHKQSAIYVDELVALPRWYGKRQHPNEGQWTDHHAVSPKG